MMSDLPLSHSGYVCAPYLHNHTSLKLKDALIDSSNIEKLFFVTGTFSSDSKPVLFNFCKSLPVR